MNDTSVARARTASAKDVSATPTLDRPAVDGVVEAAPATTSLSVLVPVYNEQYLVAASLARLRVLEQSPHLAKIQVIVVDDCSRDETPAVLARFREEEQNRPGRRIDWVFHRHEKNAGKGQAVRTAIERAENEITVIHDADLEYHPRDLLRVVEVFVYERADAVFGSRFAGSEVRRVLMYRHELGNKFLTALCNSVTNLNLTDMETCYKAVRTRLLKSIPLVSNDFRIEPELAIKLAKRQARIFEVPISYSGRTYQEGKKIGWRDGFAALKAIGEFAISDDIFKADASGAHIVAEVAQAQKFHDWLTDVIRPHCGDRVWEIGSGAGLLTQALVPRKQYVASDVDPIHLDTLETLRLTRPYLRTVRADITDPKTYPTIEGGFDTVICLNVLEHIDDDVGALQSVSRVLSKDARVIVSVPQGDWNYGSLDKALGRKRRYSKASFADLAKSAGYRIEHEIEFNRAGSAAWFLNGKVLKKSRFGSLQVVALNAAAPLMRSLDKTLPLPALSLIAVLRKA